MAYIQKQSCLEPEAVIECWRKEWPRCSRGKVHLGVLQWYPAWDRAHEAQSFANPAGPGPIWLTGLKMVAFPDPHLPSVPFSAQDSINWNEVLPFISTPD